MNCPRSRFSLVLLQMNVANPKYSVFMDLFDAFFPAEKEIHEREIAEIKSAQEDRRTGQDRRIGPAIEGTEIVVIRKIESRDK